MHRPANLKQTAGLVLLNVGALLLLSLAAFSRPTERLFNGYDGQGYKTVVQQMFAWTGPDLGLPVNPFQALGALYFQNIKLLPTGILLGAGGETLGVPAAYMAATLALFLATWLLGRALGHSTVVSSTGGWILVLASMPFFELAQINPIFNIGPNMAEAFAAHTAAVACFGFALRGSLARRLLAGTTLATLVLWSMATQPTYLVALAPFALAMATGMILTIPEPRFRTRRMIVALIPLAVVLALGGMAYLLGVMTNTAAAMFGHEMNQTIPRLASLVSIAFQGPVHGWLGPALVAAAGVGLVVNLATPPGGAGGAREMSVPQPFHHGLAGAVGAKRRAMIAVLAVLSQVVIAAVFLATSGSWTFPVPYYFEIEFWPLYGLYAAEALILFTAVMPRLRPKQKAAAAAAFAIAAGAAFVHLQPNIPRNDGFGRRPATNQFTTIMARDLGLTPGGQFKGYAATFAGYGGAEGPPADWITLVLNDDKVVRATGNFLRMAALWHFNIPTLEEYQPLTSPAYYAVTSRLLSRPQDRQTRNIPMLSKPHLPLLRSMGVSHVITDEALPEGVERARMQVDGLLPIRLYELSDPNRGDYSPNEAVVVPTAAEALNEMSRDGFDFRRQIVLFADPGGALVPASSARLEVVVDGYRIAAQSPGRSLLLLPIQFSHCMRVEAPAGTPPRLLRANLAQTALLFEGQIDIRLRIRAELFSGSWCRLQDAGDARRMDLRSIERGSGRGW